MAVDDKYTPDPVVQDKASSSEEGLESIQDGTIKKISRISSIMTVVVSGLALFSDGYNAQIIGYMKPLLKLLYKDGLSDTMSTRLSNSYRASDKVETLVVSCALTFNPSVIGEIFGMLFFGFVIDKIGRRTGIVFATLFLVLGIVLASELMNCS